jgi:predicted flap endonuclease-1-like 5' DNA nuclease
VDETIDDDEEDDENQLDSEESEKDAKKAEEAEAKAAKAEIKKAEASMTKEEKKVAGLKRVKANAAKIDFAAIGVATMDDRDDLQSLKGIGPFLEEKLNALGIYTFKQISKMSSELEDQVNIAIEFFPGRVKRDQWVDQCKAILNDD